MRFTTASANLEFAAAAATVVRLFFFSLLLSAAATADDSPARRLPSDADTPCPVCGDDGVTYGCGRASASPSSGFARPAAAAAPAGRSCSSSSSALSPSAPPFCSGSSDFDRCFGYGIDSNHSFHFIFFCSSELIYNFLFRF